MTETFYAMSFQEWMLAFDWKYSGHKIHSYEKTWGLMYDYIIQKPKRDVVPSNPILQAITNSEIKQNFGGWLPPPFKIQIRN